MQVLFISDKAQVIKFLSGLQAEAMMPQDIVEVTGMSQDSMVTVICSGASTHYKGTITRIDSAYQPMSRDGKWLDVKFLVRRKNPSTDFHFDHSTVND